MKIRILILILLVTGFSSHTVFGQAKLTTLEYTVGFGMGDLNDFIGKPSFRGATLEYHKMMHSNIGVGFELGWSAFYEALDYDTYTLGTASLSGKQYRYCSTVPVLASANYYLKPGKEVNPFAGIGIGAQFSRSDIDMGIFNNRVDTWHFALKPEVGVICRIAATTGLVFSAKYYQSFKTEESDPRSYFAGNIGLVWGY
jgi:hypothetical protein